MDSPVAKSIDAIAARLNAPAGVDRRSLIRGLAIFAVYAVLYAVTLVESIADFPLWANLLFALGNGICIAMLLIVAHDACHGALVPGRRLNRWLGRIAFVPVVHSASLWRQVHNQNHHGRTNLKGVDPVWAPMGVKEYAAASPARRFVERVYRGAFGPFVYYVFDIWLAMMVLPLSKMTRKQWKRHLPDTLFVLGGFALTVAAIVFIGEALAPARALWLTLLLGWGIPYAVFSYLAAITVYLNHTHPDLPWFDSEETWSYHNGNVRGTAHVTLPLDIFPLYSEVMQHTAHHANPGVPIYALAGDQAKLKALFGHEVKQYLLTVGAYRHILKACKLFDFERMCWTDFAGNATGPAYCDPLRAPEASVPAQRTVQAA
ncbi:MAG TPA: fatty acid desaturase [Rhizomicrobium sp.]|jgi:omega-6 fatty acid desaturase (delta-12 desaturase)|nr:fatty acid desaturase [Rhizomicrobium sp.]